MIGRLHKHRIHQSRRGGALYILVVGCAAMVSMLGLAGLTLARITGRELSLASDALDARWNARSGIQRGLAAIAADPNWRDNFQSGSLAPPAAIGSTEAGTIAWKIEDSDGSFKDLDQRLRVTGVGKTGGAAQAISVQILASDQIGPDILRSMTSTASQSSDELNKDKRWCQYLKPTLPPKTLKWWVTSVSLYCRRASSNKTIDVEIARPWYRWPTSHVFVSTSVNSSGLSSSWGWRSFDFTDVVPLDPTQDICIAFSSSSNSNPIDLTYRTGGMSEAATALIIGDKDTWGFPMSDKALRYRLDGVYTLAKERAEPVPLSWTWEAVP